MPGKVGNELGSVVGMPCGSGGNDDGSGGSVLGRGNGSVSGGAEVDGAGDGTGAVPFPGVCVDVLGRGALVVGFFGAALAGAVVGGVSPVAAC